MVVRAQGANPAASALVTRAAVEETLSEVDEIKIWKQLLTCDKSITRRCAVGCILPRLQRWSVVEARYTKTYSGRYKNPIEGKPTQTHPAR